MAQQSLYRRYRPRNFGQLRGQDHVVRALRNAVNNSTEGHAYLFSGPRGTGKTSTARILAKALNCENLHDGEPCCECSACQEIEAGRSFDLMELDAASNNGVDAIRDLIERSVVGSPGRTKVYILDEVHMLSTPASNALLKTLEEPPDQVCFVLATTDPHKVLPTIRSRTQHFEFNLLTAAELEDYVRWVVADADLSVDDEAVSWVVRQGRGSARDTLSALDQVVAAGGVVIRSEPVDQLYQAIADRDTGAAISAVADSLAHGHDPRVLGDAFLVSLRDCFLVALGVEVPHLVDADRDRLATWAAALGTPTITRTMESIGSALVEMRQAADPRIPLEVALVRLTSSADNSLEALAARVAALEAALESGGGVVAATPSSRAAAPTRTAAAAAPSDTAPSDNAPSDTAAESAPAAANGGAGGVAGARAALARTRGGSPGAESAAPTPAAPAAPAAPAPAAPAAPAPAGPPPTPTPAPAPPTPATPPAPAPDAPTTAAMPVPVPADVTAPGPAPAPAAPVDSDAAGSSPSPVPAESPTGPPSGPAGPTTSPGGRPALGALRGRQGRPGGPPATPSASPPSVPSTSAPNSSAPTPSSPAPSASPPSASPPSAPISPSSATPEPASESTPSAAPVPPTPPVRSASPTAATAVASAGEPNPDLSRITAIFTDNVLTQLKGVAKALFSHGRVVALNGNQVVFAVENGPTRERAEKFTGPVEAALTAQTGQAMTLRLVTEADAGSLGATAPTAAEVLEDESEIMAEVDQLEVADVAVSGIEKLTQAFPGAQLLDAAEHEERS